MAVTLDRTKFFEKIGHTPHPAQELYHYSKARFRIPVCGRRFGKSWMVARDLEPKLFLPKKRYWCVGPTYDLAEKEFRVIWDDLIIGQQLGLNKKLRKAYNKRSGEMYIEFPWQTRLECRSSSHPETLVGESLDGVVVSEAAKQAPDTWERFLRPALADRRGFADFPTTPDGLNWLYDLYMLGLNPQLKGIYESWCFPSWLNTFVFPGGPQDKEILLLKASMSEEEFAQEIAADFSSFRGKIYHEFSEKHHVRPHIYRPDWPNYISFDWGMTSPLAAVEFQVSPWDQVFVWREHYKAYLTLPEHLQIMKDRAQPPGYQINLCFGDAADPNAIAEVNKSFAPCIGMPESKANWSAGVQTVKRFLKLRQVGEIDEYGTPKEEPLLFVDFACPNVIREFNNYRTRKPGSSDPVESNARGAAQKQDDHAMDALRYGLVHLFDLGVNHHLEEVMEPTSSVSSSGQGYFTTGMRF